MAAWKLLKTPEDAEPSDRSVLLATFLICALLAANIINAARVFTMFWANASRASLYVQVAIVVYFIIVAIRRQDWRLVGAALGIATYFVFAHALFVMHVGSATNLNAIAPYLPLLAFVIFYEVDLPIGQILRIWAIVGSVYLLFYVLANHHMANTTDASTVLLENHNQSGKRVFLASAHASFVAFYGLKMTSMRWPIRAFLVGLSGAAMWMSGSRTFMLVFALIFVLAATGQMSRMVRGGLFLLVVGVAAAMLAGLILPDWNPFHYMVWDDSAYYRSREYSVAMRVLTLHPWTGIGVAGAPLEFQHYLGMPRYELFYGSDLGILGPFIDFGFLGLLAFLAALYFALIPDAPSKRNDVDAVKLTCITCAVDGMISPILLFDPSALFLIFLVSVWLRRNRALRHFGSYAPQIRQHLATGTSGQ